VNSESFARRARRELATEFPGYLALVEASLCVLDAMTEQIKNLERAIAEMAAERYRETEFLTRLAGVGPITAFVFTIGDPTRFKNKRDVAAFLGLVPLLRRTAAGFSN
jgi:transposase